MQVSCTDCGILRPGFFISHSHRYLLFSNGSVLRNRVYHLVEKKLFDELMSFIEDNVEGYLTTMGPGNIAP